MKKIVLAVVLLALLGVGGWYAYRNFGVDQKIENNNQTDQNGNNNSVDENNSKPEKKVEENKEDEWKKLSAHDYTVPVLMYHYIRDYKKTDDPIGVNLSVSPAVFEEQMKWLKDHGYQTFGPSELDRIARLDPGVKPIILTFDDGYRDAYTGAWPILKKYEYKGVFYLIAGSLGDPAYMTWDMAKEMLDSGMIIGSHTISHPDLRNVNDEELHSQLNGSRSLIKDHLNIVVTDFCYPAGKYDDKVINKLRELDYKTATTVSPGLTDQNSDPYQIPRYRITNESNFDYLFGE